MLHYHISSHLIWSELSWTGLRTSPVQCSSDEMRWDEMRQCNVNAPLAVCTRDACSRPAVGRLYCLLCRNNASTSRSTHTRRAATCPRTRTRPSFVSGNWSSRRPSSISSWSWSPWTPSYSWWRCCQVCPRVYQLSPISLLHIYAPLPDIYFDGQIDHIKSQPT